MFTPYSANSPYSNMAKSQSSRPLEVLNPALPATKSPYLLRVFHTKRKKTVVCVAEVTFGHKSLRIWPYVVLNRIP